MTAGTAFAISRLQKKKIYCISPPRVNVSGMLELMCFDKTGTLTEEGLDLLGVRPAVNKEFLPEIPASDVASMEKQKQLQNLFYAMACCHSLSYVEEKLVGDPLELKIFEATKWV